MHYTRHCRNSENSASEDSLWGKTLEQPVRTLPDVTEEYGKKRARTLMTDGICKVEIGRATITTK